MEVTAFAYEWFLTDYQEFETKYLDTLTDVTDIQEPSTPLLPQGRETEVI